MNKVEISVAPWFFLLLGVITGWGWALWLGKAFFWFGLVMVAIFAWIFQYKREWIKKNETQKTTKKKIKNILGAILSFALLVYIQAWWTLGAFFVLYVLVHYFKNLVKNS